MSGLLHASKWTTIRSPELGRSDNELNPKTKVGIVGLGLMGSAIASNLLARGFEVHGFNRTPERAQAMKEKGVTIHPRPNELASNVEVLITSLTDENAVEELALAEDGFLSALNKNGVWIEMSTIDRDASISLAEKAQVQLDMEFAPAAVFGRSGMKQLRVTREMESANMMSERQTQIGGLLQFHTLSVDTIPLGGVVGTPLLM